MGYGKTIEMFLVDGTADGIVTAELSNWDGKAIKIPRSQVAEYVRDDIRGVGVYFLFGPAQSGGETVYIGESEDVLTRLKQHLKDEQPWSCAVAFTGKDLDKATIRWLEYQFVELAKRAGRDEVLTQNTYSTHLKESKIASMEEFRDNVKVLLPVLNFHVLEPAPQAATASKGGNVQQPSNERQATDGQQAPDSHASILVFCTGRAGADAQGMASGDYPRDNRVEVLEGSRIASEVAPSFPKTTYYDLWRRLTSDGTIQGGVFSRSYLFESPSAAASIVLGRSANGRDEWKTKQGMPLGIWGDRHSQRG